MFFNDTYIQNDVIEVALQSLALRNQVIQNNIANSELPNFKKSKVMFENVLSDVVEDYEKTGELSLSKVKPSVVVVNKDLSYRLDGNNVDVETEMMDLYQSDAKYSTLVSSVINNYKRINLALSVK